MLFLGADCGATRTTVAVCNEKGEILGRGKGGPGNHLTVGMDRMLESISEALKDAGFENASFEVAVLGLSGLGLSRKAAGALQKEISKVVRAKTIEAYNDGVVALWGAIATRKKGAIVVAGTGSVVLGTDESGNLIKAGGWGHILGDEGSAYRLSFDAIRYAMKAWEGRAQKTSLVREVEKFFKMQSVEDAIGAFYVKGISKDKVASFAPKFMLCVEKGDPSAKEILEQNIRELALTACSVARKLGIDEVSYTGGMFNSKTYRQAFEEALLGCSVRLVEPTLSPTGGALLAALRRYFGNVPPEVLKRLKEGESKSESGLCKG